MASENNVKQAVPFFGVDNIEASLRFYIEGLGFRIKYNWIHEGKLRWCWLELGDAVVMLQEFWTDGHHAGKPDGKLGLGMSVYFMCQDAIAIYHELIARGIKASRPFVGNHLWVTGLTDPDGYQLFFESPTDVPEDTIYSDPSSGRAT